MLTRIEQNFNKLICGARVIIEKTFGVLVARFRVLSKRIDLKAENVKKVVIACCVLHNMLIDQVPAQEVNFG